MKLKDAIEVKHREAERHPFNQKMFGGQLSEYEYVTYLNQLWSIFFELERDNALPHPNLYRLDCIEQDILELNVKKAPIMTATFEYTDYLRKLSKKQRLPHVYLHYMALMFGGQMMKKKVPGSGMLYTFKNTESVIMSIRQIQKDEWADEVNKGLQYFIDILDELHEQSEQLI